MRVRLLLIGFIFIIISVVAVIKSDFFAIKSLIVEGDIFCLNLESFEQSVNIRGENIFLFDPADVANQLTQRHLCLKTVEIKKELPSQVRINLTERKPFIKVASFTPKPTLALSDLEATSSSQAALLDWSYVLSSDLMTADEEGVIFQEEGGDNLPQLFLPNQEIKIGKKLNRDLFKKLKEIVKMVAYSKVKIKVFDSSLLIQTNFDEYPGEGKLAVSLEKDLAVQLASLQLILQKAKIDNRPMEIIDLRFDKPVVIYVSKK